MEFIGSLEAAMQLCPFEIFFGFCDLKAALNDWLFIQVMAAPVLNNQNVVWFPVLTFTLPTHRLSSNCGSTARLPLSGVT
jgi:hypothetical protein